MVLHPCSPGGGACAGWSRIAGRRAGADDPIWEGTRAADPDTRPTPRYRISGQRAGCRAGQRAGCRAGIREPDVLPARRDPGAGHKKTPGLRPRGGVRGAGPLNQIDVEDQLVPDDVAGGICGGFVHAVRDFGPNGVDVGDVAGF